MSEKSAEYSAIPPEALTGDLRALHVTGGTLRIRMNFEIQSKGNCKPDVTIELEAGLGDNAKLDLTLHGYALLVGSALPIATVLGKRWERQYAGVGAADVAAPLTDVEEVAGWLLEKQAPGQASGS